MKTRDIDRRIADLVAINPRPRQPAALVELGRDLLARDVESATKCFDKALAIDPRHVPAWIARAEALSLSGRKGQAVGCLERALDVEPNNGELAEKKKKLLAELALASSRNRRFEPPPVEARAPESRPAPVTPRPEPKSEPKSEPRLAPKSEPRPDEAKPEPEPQAKQETKREAKPEPKREAKPEPKREAKPEPKADAKSEPNPAPPSAIELDAVPRSEPQATTPLDEAIALFAAGEHIAALRKVGPLTKQEGAGAETWILRGEICAALDQIDEAIASYDRATKADPSSVAAWMALAKRRFAAKRLERALDAADQALRLAPFDGRIQKLRGKILVALGQPAAAVTALEKATQHAPDDAEAWLELGRARSAAKKPDGAREALQRALGIAETMKRELVPAVTTELEKLTP